MCERHRVIAHRDGALSNQAKWGLRMITQDTTTPAPSSMIAKLAEQRAAIYRDAHAGDGRDFTDEEEARVEALNSVIAHANAIDQREAIIQLDVAAEYFALEHDDVGTHETREIAHAALRSARKFLAGDAPIGQFVG
jgi:hypothetical protein